VGPLEVGRPLQPAVEGGSALLTAEGERLLAAAIAAPDRPVRWDVRPNWHGEVKVVALGTAGQVAAKQVDCDGRLAVELKAEPSGLAWKVSVAVRNPAGDPQAAEVVLVGLDRELLRVAGQAPAVGPALLATQVGPPDAVGGVAHRLRHVAAAREIAASLLAETAREQERRRAQQAVAGSLRSNALAEAFQQEVPLVLDGLGMIGTGSGSPLCGPCSRPTPQAALPSACLVPAPPRRGRYTHGR